MIFSAFTDRTINFNGRVGFPVDLLLERSCCVRTFLQCERRGTSGNSRFWVHNKRSTYVVHYKLQRLTKVGRIKVQMNRKLRKARALTAKRESRGTISTRSCVGRVISTMSYVASVWRQKIFGSAPILICSPHLFRHLTMTGTTDSVVDNHYRGAKSQQTPLFVLTTAH